MDTLPFSHVTISIVWKTRENCNSTTYLLYPIYDTATALTLQSSEVHQHTPFSHFHKYALNTLPWLGKINRPTKYGITVGIIVTEVVVSFAIMLLLMLAVCSFCSVCCWVLVRVFMMLVVVKMRVSCVVVGDAFGGGGT